jgi:hypothetical protein
VNDHRPRRPQWSCRACGEAWPCAPAQKLLSEAYHQNPEALAAHLVRLTGLAAADLSEPVPASLYGRFVAWTLDRNRTCRVCGGRRHDVLPGLPIRFFPCGKIHERPT